MKRFLAVALVPLLLPAGGSLVAQEASGGRAEGVIAGLVVDAGSGTALPGALIVLESVGDGTVLRPAGANGFISRGLSAVTGADGAYRIAGLAPGPYRLYVRHLAYREAALDIELSQSSFHLSVGLVVQPI